MEESLGNPSAIQDYWTSTGPDGQGLSFLDRNTFHEIGEESFKWRKDRSFDGGETCLEGVAWIHCRAGRGS